MKTCRSTLVLVTSLALPLWMGCSGEPPQDGDEVASDSEAIVNGSLDTTHQAVVAWLHGSKCTATIIKTVTATGIGYALSSGLCVPGPNGQLRQGNNHNSGYVSYTVTTKQAHPDYGQGVGKTEAYDVAIVTFSGATAATPVLDVLTPAADNLSAGTVLDLIGYGNTENGGTSLRHHINKPIDSESDIFIYFDQTMSGICSGDSGGPSLTSAQRVAGVHSRAGAQGGGCTGTMGEGIDIRASAFWDSFINPVLNNNTPSGVQTCDQCVEGHANVGWDGDCESEVLGCFQTQTCVDYVNCFSQCTTQLCVNQCKQSHQQGAALYDAIDSCLCNNACASECASAGFCNPPTCGLDLTDNTCQSCLEVNCCAEAQACSTDVECLDCLGSLAPTGCTTDPETQDLQACADDHCQLECSFNFNQQTGSGGGGGAPAGVGGSGAGVGVGGFGGDPSSGSGNPDDEGDLTVVEGCGCRIVGQPSLGQARSAASGAGSRAGWWALALAGLGLVAARRRRA